ncbi:hypothetical protein SVAN01_06207 [Stagonosporopsis vannaccii]|nr:hypothetical protein SVAN01_06207 [Stagonosporopsis vannaccii]
MTSTDLPRPNDFEKLASPELKTFPQPLFDRPGRSKSSLSTLLRNNTFRIVVCTISFLAMIGGTAAAALLISRAMERINEGHPAFSATTSLLNKTATPTPLRYMVTMAMVCTQTSVVTGRTTICLAGAVDCLCYCNCASCLLPGWEYRG